MMPPLASVDRALRRLLVTHAVASESGCLLWRGAVAGGARGRPCFRLGGQTYYVARALLAVRLGRGLRRGMVAAHRCDQPMCVTVHHLAEVSYSENLRAAWARGRRRPRRLMSLETVS